MPYGLTYKGIEKLADELSNELLIPKESILEAIDKITRKEVARIAKNEIEP